jgi:hypothetical protein
MRLTRSNRAPGRSLQEKIQRGGRSPSRSHALTGSYRDTHEQALKAEHRRPREENCRAGPADLGGNQNTERRTPCAGEENLGAEMISTDAEQGSKSRTRIHTRAGKSGSEMRSPKAVTKKKESTENPQLTSGRHRAGLGPNLGSA